jgi:hypothetical protein
MVDYSSEPEAILLPNTKEIQSFQFLDVNWILVIEKEVFALPFVPLSRLYCQGNFPNFSLHSILENITSRERDHNHCTSCSLIPYLSKTCLGKGLSRHPNPAIPSYPIYMSLEHTYLLSCRL